MSRLPAILSLSGGKSQRQRVWEALRRASVTTADGCFCADELSRASQVEIAPVREYLKCLSAAGVVAPCQRPVPHADGRVRKSFKLTQDNGVEAPRLRRDGTPVTQGRGTEAMWAAMTVLDAFDHGLLADIAQVKATTAASYCHALGKAAYLDVLIPGQGKGRGGIATTWAVNAVHRMKPRAPMITRLHAVYDPNIHQIVWAEGADEAADAVEVGEVV